MRSPKLQRAAPHKPYESNMELFLALPADTCVAPRGGVGISQTKDMLFLASLLRRAGTAHYFFMQEDGAIIPESEGVDDADQPAGKLRIRRATVRRWFRDGFFPFRRMLASGDASGLVIKLNGADIRTARKWSFGQPWALGKTLKWPFEKGHDPLLNHLHQILMFDWQDSIPLSKGEVYCPLDGPVVPVKADLITAPITWKMLCGRHWRVLLCPHCLGQFQNELISLN